MRSHVPAAGATVWIRERRWRVERARRDRDVVRLDVVGRDGRLTFLLPFDRVRVVAGTQRPTWVRPQRAVALLSGLVGRGAFNDRSLPAAPRAAIEILPYQLEPALAILRSARRVLLADAVGLGKTIQTGLVIAELRRRDPAVRILIAVPSALRRQWIDELQAHFGITATLADGTAQAELARAESRTWTPWDRAGTWVGSIDYLKQPHICRELVRTPWDLLVIDEAHGVCGDTERHDALAAIARGARKLMLLTATPHSGDARSFQRLLAIGRLPGVDDAPTVFRRTREDIGMASDRRTRWHRVSLSLQEIGALNAIDEFERTVRARGDRPEALLLLSVFRKRALSTMGALARSVDRRLAFLDARANGTDEAWLQGRLMFDESGDDISGDERRALCADTGLPEALERSRLRRLQQLARAAARHESRIRQLIRFVRRSRAAIVIFTEFRDSLNVLLPHIEAIRTAAILHGGQGADEQQRQIDRFLGGTASILIATDVASQGLNLQTRARCVLNLDLPWNPSRIEQRAGRVDRIGQRGRVHVGFFVARHEADANLRARLTDRSLAAAQCFDAGPDAGVALCTRWRRAVRVLAVGLRRQRAFATRCRDRRGHRPFAVHIRALPHLRRLAANAALFIFAAPIYDGTSGLIERRIVCVRGPSEWSEFASTIESARALAAQTIQPRVRRLERLRAAESKAAIEIEMALGRTWLGHRAHVEVQPGLFDRRAVEADRHATDDALRISSTLQQRIERLEREAVVCAGTPILAAILIPRP